MRVRLMVFVGALSVSGSSAALASDLTMILRDGRVTMVADNVPLRQILAEWARVGQTRIVGAERLTGGLVTLRFDGVPEKQALETLLREASGFMAAPRAVPLADASQYDRILILPTSTTPEAAPAQGRGGIPLTGRRPSPAPPAGNGEEPVDAGDDLPADFDENMKRGLDPADVDPGYLAPEANFDYANPQLMLQRRQQQEQAGTVQPAGSARPGLVQPVAQAPSVFPGTANPQPAPQTAPFSARPGEVVQQPQQPTNPYGIPGNVQPGTVQGPAVEPDRAKYMNPYQPEPNPPE